MPTPQEIIGCFFICQSLIESLVRVILSLCDEERSLLGEKLFFDLSEPSSSNFLNDEPDIYSLTDGEPI
ncbi:MAG: hypothetical protein RMY29_020095 [Nostoc sp. CreGUA01]|nr:hypothetical protein [Nostoc sp. CreGUA01]